MDQRVADILKDLEMQSDLESGGVADVKPSDRMLAVPRDAGRMLNVFVRAAGARRVLELGTSVGYSTIWIAEALPDKSGGVTTIEQNPSKVTRALENFEAAGVSNRVDVRLGKISDVLDGMSGCRQEPFDGAFVDADKENVVRYFDTALGMIRRGGFVVVDNMTHPRKYARYMGALESHARSLPYVRMTVVPVGNGMLFAVKIG